MPNRDAHHPSDHVLAALAHLDASQVLSEALDTLPGGLFTIDAQRHITSWNSEMARLTGYSAQEILGQPCTLLQGDACFTGTCTGPEDACGLWDAGEVTQKRCTVRRKDGERVAVVKNARLLRNAQGEITGALESALDVSDVLRLEAEVAALQQAVQAARPCGRIIGSHPLMQQLFDRVALAAQSDASVLILGETGTGKELVAEAIHQASPRRDGPFVRVNCAALPETLLESELFGHRRGAFTGALTDRMGRFEAADGGTLLLDELGDVPLAMQGKLLRVLQEREIERIGDNHARPVDIRVIAATHRDLRALMAAGQFREDLYYRVAVVPIELPALRDRLSDLPALVDHFLARCAQRRRQPPKALSAATMHRLRAHHWPGNVRELQHALEYATVLTRGSVIEPDCLPPDVAQPGPRPAPPPRRRRLDAATIRAALLACDGRRAEAATRLGVSRVTLWKWMKRLDIQG